MNKNGINEILKLNEQFYQQIAQEFSDTRNTKWEGWDRVAEYIKSSYLKPTKVLDIGCGNGRFYRFLQGKIEIEYTGLDSSAELLKIARAYNPNARFIYGNILGSDSLNSGKFQVVAAFGLTHHIPDSQLRRRFFLKLCNLILPCGSIILTFWDFDRTKAVQNTGYNQLLEKNDYILSWNNNPALLRYCHYYDKDEREKVIEIFRSKSCILENEFVYDGKDKQSNRYLIFRNTDKI